MTDTIQYRRSRRAKRLRLTVQPNGQVRVSVPRFVPMLFARDFVSRHQDWIVTQRRKLALSESKTLLFKPGVEFFTKTSELKFQLSNKFSIQSIGDKVIVHYTEDTVWSEMQDVIKSAIIVVYRREAKDYIIPKVEAFADQFGFEYNKVTIKKIVSRWGSCSARKNLNFSLHLMRLDEKYIDYVILHELCHTREMNHGPKFWNLLSEVCPNAKKIDRDMRSFSPRW